MFEWPLSCVDFVDVITGDIPRKAIPLSCADPGGAKGALPPPSPQNIAPPNSEARAKRALPPPPGAKRALAPLTKSWIRLWLCTPFKGSRLDIPTLVDAGGGGGGAHSNGSFGCGVLFPRGPCHVTCHHPFAGWPPHPALPPRVGGGREGGGNSAIYHRSARP